MRAGRRLAALALAAVPFTAAAVTAASTVLPPTDAHAPSPPPPALRRVGATDAPQPAPPERRAAVPRPTPTTPPATTPPTIKRAPAGPTSTTAAPTTSTTIATHDARPAAFAVPEAAVAPVRLTIPAIRVDAAITPTGIDAAGQMAIPEDARELAWWQHGPAPGDPGSAVIAGHLDWKGVVGAFASLRELRVGDLVVIHADDGSATELTVTDVALVDKAVLPQLDTFRSTGDPVVRLITCGGAYDAGARRYRDNVVVTAAPA